MGAPRDPQHVHPVIRDDDGRIAGASVIPAALRPRPTPADARERTRAAGDLAAALAAPPSTNPTAAPANGTALPTPTDLYSIPEAARIVRMTDAGIRHRIQTGRLRVYGTGRALRVSLSDLMPLRVAPQAWPGRKRDPGTGRYTPRRSAG